MTRAGYLLTATGAALLLITLAMVHVAPRLVWNASASVPVGLYEIGSATPLEVTDLVAVNAPEPLAAFLADRGYLPRGVPLLKRVAALPGQTVCRAGAAITVDGIALGNALDRDRLGRTLPIWKGCHQIGANELFLMNIGVLDSLDGRYFGPLAVTTVIGRATPLYTDEDGDGRFVWRAPTR
ncbi:MAG: S26 family signal peptidase [Proteobacteria bacterium]|nr:MAG: S26 family signal peptidase [Pseudomonadota bacterium]